MLNKHAKKSVQRSGRRGAIMVEFVIVLPVLCALIFGMIDMGLLLKDSLALSHLAKDAARSYALGTDWATITTRITTPTTGYAAKVGLDPSKFSDLLASPPEEHEDDSGDPTDTQVLHNIEVTLTYRHSTIAGGLWGGPGTGIVTLTGTGIHLRE